MRLKTGVTPADVKWFNNEPKPLRKAERFLYKWMLSSQEIMKYYSFFLTIFLFATTLCSTIPKPKDRSIDKKLSDLDHETNGIHNPDYDHEAILGKDDAKDFDQLSPEQSKEKLGKIVDKMDKDRDGYVTEEELKNWIKYVQDKYIVNDSNERWKDYEFLDTDKLDWETFKKKTYGFTEEDIKPTDEKAVYKEMITRDKRRWAYADLDKDNHLTKTEFMHFLHPEEADHMRDIVVLETLEDIDKDKDGKVSLEEYITDIYGNEDEDDEDEDDPDWVNEEKEQFHNFRDKNKDGFLDKAEVTEWLIPEEFNHLDTEVSHLVRTSDVDQDGKLSKNEILDKYDLFVGSQATDFGEALKSHDEF
ncbi:calumenin-B-like isoform X1 [Octopus vulgaris]|uniref:Reticulocalbin-3 n=2 Tax=Octopus vulgaris TaxID=6645 RepID=A0AA36FJ51_OCTVU|nr:calumenin-B-like isoform X1 [Octopus vulgaris]